MTIIFTTMIIIIFAFIFCDHKRIKIFIMNILKSKIENVNNNKNLINRRKTMKTFKKRNTHVKNNNNRKTQKKNSFKHGPPRKGQRCSKKSLRDNNKNIRGSKKRLIYQNENKKNKIKINNESAIGNSKRVLNRKSTINININNINIKRPKLKSKTHNLKNKNIILYKDDKKNNNINIPVYNDCELNSLSYYNAIKYDERTYCQYYISLLKTKHLILFTFIPSNDYNLYTIKIILFLLSFSLYFCINGLFFNDETMHKIYVDKGAYNIMYQIPQIVYSSVFSALINIILKQLSLSQKDILKLKQEKDERIANKKSKTIYICLNIKFIIFFILCLIFMAFFWYFISGFCAVFSNTQVILIKDTLLSFGLSMLYPFALNLLPGFFRIPALNAKYKDKVCLYKISMLVALI